MITGDGMRALNAPDGYLIAKQGKDCVIFTEKGRILEDIFKTSGIVIPASEKNHFSGRTVVYLTDSDFAAAFWEIYVNNTLLPQGYRIATDEGD